MTIPLHNPQGEAHRKALEVLDILDRWNERSNGHFTQQRQFSRKSYRSSIVAVFTQSGDPHEPPQPVRVRVWSRNLGQGGVGFIYPGLIQPQKIVISLDPDAKIWMHAEIVRARKVHDGFWDYGARFLGRAEPPQE